MQGDFVEACAGTAALTFALFGAKPPVPMAGSKRTLAKALLERVWPADLPRPTRVLLNDAGEWGHTLRAMFDGHALGSASRGGWHRIAGWLEAWIPENERALFDRLRRAPPPEDPFERAAAHLYLQTRTFRGKPVYPNADGTGWVTHGFDPEYREAVTPGAKSRGWFNSRPILAEKLRALAKVPWPEITVTGWDAATLPDLFDLRDARVVIDPPYAETQSAIYGVDLNRTRTLALANQCAGRGATTFVSEGAPLVGPLGPGWRAEQIPTRKTGTQLGIHEEWLTWKCLTWETVSGRVVLT